MNKQEHLPRGPMGAVAASRVADRRGRKTVAESILDQDANLVRGSFEPAVYQPITVCGIDIKLEPVAPALGTIVHGLDLQTDIENPEIITFLRQLWLDRRVIMFRDQAHLTRLDQVRFAECFGELGSHHGERDHVPLVPDWPPTPEEHEDILLIISDEKNVQTVASQWHSDATWSTRPPMGSILLCREAPPVGGDTNFCDCHGLWEGLPGELKELARTLKAKHRGHPHHAMDGTLPEAVHPVARTHPETGRTTLFVNPIFVNGLMGERKFGDTESRQILGKLLERLGRPEVTCRFRWAPGSIAMWDNRAVQHCATGDFWPHQRLMERVTILDHEQDRRTPYYSGQDGPTA